MRIHPIFVPFYESQEPKGSTEVHGFQLRYSVGRSTLPGYLVRLYTPPASMLVEKLHFIYYTHPQLFS